MNDFGEMSSGGVVLSNDLLRESRFRRGECETCGLKCFKKSLFKSIPLTEPGRVYKGRCLVCKPLTLEELKRGTSTTAKDNHDNEKSQREGHPIVVCDAQVTVASQDDIKRVNVSMGNLMAGIKRDKRVFKFVRSNSDGSVWKSRGSNRSLGARSFDSSKSSNRQIIDDVLQEEEDELVEEKTNDSHDEHSSRCAMISEEPGRERGDGMRTKSYKWTPTGTSNMSSQDTGQPRITTKISESTDETQGVAPGDVSSKSYVDSLSTDSYLTQEGEFETISNDPSNVEMTKPLLLSQFSESSLDKKPKAIDDDTFKALNIVNDHRSTYAEIIKTMTQYPNHKQIQESGVFSISNMDLNRIDQRQFIEEGITVLLESMSSNSDEVELLVHVCNIFLKFCTNQSNRQAIGHIILEQIVNVMGHHRSQTKLQGVSLQLVGLLGREDSNQRIIYRIGCLEEIIKTMEFQNKAIEIQKEACIAIRQMLRHDGGLQKQFVSANGPQQISIAMVLFSFDAIFLSTALAALRGFKDDCKLGIVHSGCIDSIVSGMQIHRENEDLQSSSIETISDLASAKETRHIICDNGAMDVTLRAMWMHPGHGEIHRWSCEALDKFISHSSNRDLFIEIGGIASVVNSMQNHSENAQIQILSCEILLKTIKGNPTHIEVKIVEEETLDAIAIAMVLHSNDVKVQQHACLLLRKLVCKENIDPLLAANIPELVCTAAALFIECKEAADYITNSIEMLEKDAL